jgi:hypothetical protein
VSKRERERERERERIVRLKGSPPNFGIGSHMSFHDDLLLTPEPLFSHM